MENDGVPRLIWEISFGTGDGAWCLLVDQAAPPPANSALLRTALRTAAEIKKWQPIYLI